MNIKVSVPRLHYNRNTIVIYMYYIRIIIRVFIKVHLISFHNTSSSNLLSSSIGCGCPPCGGNIPEGEEGYYVILMFPYSSATCCTPRIQGCNNVTHPYAPDPPKQSTPTAHTVLLLESHTTLQPQPATLRTLSAPISPPRSYSLRKTDAFA